MHKTVADNTTIKTQDEHLKTARKTAPEPKLRIKRHLLPTASGFKLIEVNAFCKVFAVELKVAQRQQRSRSEQRWSSPTTATRTTICHFKYNMTRETTTKNKMLYNLNLACQTQFDSNALRQSVCRFKQEEHSFREQKQTLS